MAKKKEQKRLICQIQMCSLSESDNPTKMPVEFILHDFEFSHNNTRIQKIVAQNALATLKDMPIVAKYHSVSESGAEDDALGGHEAHLDETRDGDLYVATDTIAIGVFNADAYIDTVEIEGVTKEVVKGKGIFWASRYPDVVGLLQEWWNNGIPITSSVEILYDEYKVKEGKEDILNYLYEGHCVLNSEIRGNHDVVLPAYDVSMVTKFQKLVAEALEKDALIQQSPDDINNLTSEEENKMSQEMFKKVFELSHDDVRSKLYQGLRETLTVDEYYNAYICEVFDAYFIASMSDGYYKINYTKDADAETVSVNWENKQKVEMGWINITESNEPAPVKNVNGLMTKKTETAEETTPEKLLNKSTDSTETTETTETTKVLKTSISSELETMVETLKSEKAALEIQFNDATEKLTTLNALVEELKPIKEQFEQEKLNQALAIKQEYFATKFEAVKAKEKFETDEVQNLVALSVNDSDEGRNALLQLNTMLVELVISEKTPEKKPIKEMSSKIENLIPTSNSFDDRYKT